MTKTRRLKPALLNAKPSYLHLKEINESLKKSPEAPNKLRGLLICVDPALHPSQVAPGAVQLILAGQHDASPGRLARREGSGGIRRFHWAVPLQESLGAKCLGPLATAPQDAATGTASPPVVLVSD